MTQKGLQELKKKNIELKIRLADLNKKISLINSLLKIIDNIKINLVKNKIYE